MLLFKVYGYNNYDVMASSEVCEQLLFSFPGCKILELRVMTFVHCCNTLLPCVANGILNMIANDGQWANIMNNIENIIWLNVKAVHLI